MKTIDTKSLFIGLLLGVCILLAVGATIEKQYDKGDIGRYQKDRGDIGRYQIVCPDSVSSCFVIDTTTGHVWQKYEDRSGYDLGSPDQWNKKFLHD